MERRLKPVKPATAGSVRLETLSWHSRVRAVISGGRRTPADESPCEHNRPLTLCELQKYFDSCASALEALRAHCDFSTLDWRHQFSWLSQPIFFTLDSQLRHLLEGAGVW